jgi:small GTP-binding protein
MSVVKRQLSDMKNVKKYKIIIIGDEGSGKSSLLLKFTEGTFQYKIYTTIGVDLKAKYMNIYGTIIKLHIWDTAGQERFRSIIRTYYATTSGIILVFDLANRESFLNLKIWINELRYVDKDCCPILLVGNKVDLKSNHQVTNKEIEDFIINNKLNMSYLEASAKSDINIKEIFIEIAKKVLNDDIDSNQLMTNSRILTINEADVIEFEDQKTATVMESSSCCIIS